MLSVLWRVCTGLPCARKTAQACACIYLYITLMNYKSKMIHTVFGKWEVFGHKAKIVKNGKLILHFFPSSFTKIHKFCI